MNDKEKIKELMERVGNPDAAPLTLEEQAWLDDFRRRYPFFSLSAENPAELCGPESHARIDGVADATRFDSFYPPEPTKETPSTLAAIDDFLNTYGHQSEEEDALLEKLIFNPIPDYAQQLAAQEKSNLPTPPAPDADSRADRIDRFILSQKQADEAPAQAARGGQEPSAQVARGGQEPSAQVARGGEDASAPIQASLTAQSSQPAQSSHTKSPAPQNSQPSQTSHTKSPAPASRTEKPGLLSESLAKIYIKTHRYERAYEILNDLSLRFPEKSRYFADQLRFLRKLILNEQQIKKNSINQEA